MSIVKTVNFADGQGLDPVDLNNIGKYAQAQLYDLLLRSRMRPRELNAPSALGYVHSWGRGGYIAAGGSALHSTNTAGLIALLLSAAVTGEDSSVMVYQLATDELATTHAAAHATLDRWDLICVKLEQVIGDSVAEDFEDGTTRALTSTTFSKERAVTLTKQVVAGTPATPGTAVENFGGVPVGYAVFASVFIPATFASTFDPKVHFRDQRLPLDKLDVGWMQPNLAAYLDGAAPSAAHTQGGVLFSGAGGVVAMPFPHGGQGQRLMNLIVRAKISGGGGISITRRSMANGAGGGTLASLGTTGGVVQTATIVNSGAVFNTSGSPLDQVGPLWGTGYQGGPSAGDGDFALDVSFVSGATGDYVEYVRYEMAGP